MESEFPIQVAALDASQWIVKGCRNHQTVLAHTNVYSKRSRWPKPTKFKTWQLARRIINSWPLEKIPHRTLNIWRRLCSFGILKNVFLEWSNVTMLTTISLWIGSTTQLVVVRFQTSSVWSDFLSGITLGYSNWEGLHRQPLEEHDRSAWLGVWAWAWA